MLTCKQLIEALVDYVDGRLSLSQRFAIMLHLFCCGHCSSYLQDYRSTIKASQQAMAPKDEPPAIEVPEEFVQAVLKARRNDESRDEETSSAP